MAQLDPSKQADARSRVEELRKEASDLDVRANALRAKANIIARSWGLTDEPHDTMLEEKED